MYRMSKISPDTDTDTVPYDTGMIRMIELTDRCGMRHRHTCKSTICISVRHADGCPRRIDSIIFVLYGSNSIDTYYKSKDLEGFASWRPHTFAFSKMPAV